ncbi:MAG: M15 family metallopeptidase [Oscillospiraceae bacterium]|nr:M15 family metallopeptidase [Oscillospiraceae bacterium]
MKFTPKTAVCAVLCICLIVLVAVRARIPDEFKPDTGVSVETDRTDINNPGGGSPQNAVSSDAPETGSSEGEVPVIQETPTVSEGDNTTVAPPEEQKPEETPDPMEELKKNKPDLDINSWELILVNADNTIDGTFRPELTELEGGQYFDSRAVDAIKEFIAGARAAGNSVYLSSSYRDYDTQSYLFNRKLGQYGNDYAKAASIVAPPGTSEHQTGLCADITDRYYEIKNESLENTAMFMWMNEHCAEYGFILRYPKDKQEITGIMYEPWHFRYVGLEAAAFIKENNLCLEEFVELYR